MDLQELINSCSNKLLQRQIFFSVIPPSTFVEEYLNNNEGEPQTLGLFPMMRVLYDKKPRKLTLHCSRKTLKSTLISNFLVMNSLRYNYYSQCYTAPSETQAKEFSNNYLNARFTSEKIKPFIGKFDTNNVFTKTIGKTHSTITIKYFKDDADRMRGPSYHEMCFDEVQSMDVDQLPIATSAMRLLPTKRRTYSGTPLTKDGTLTTLFDNTCGFEHFTKCSKCGHWNALMEDNDPISMIRPEGLCCSKCSTVLNTEDGLWVATRPELKDEIGYHLACPILPFYNKQPEQWLEIYNDVHKSSYSTGKIYNEIFGLAYDTGSKPITEQELRACAVLGPMKDDKGKLNIWEQNKGKYLSSWAGIDWGVNMTTSRSIIACGGLREDLVFEIFLIEIFKNFDYKDHIRQMAEIINTTKCRFSADGGPDPIRGIELIEKFGPTQGQLVRYENSRKVQYFKRPPNATDWRTFRWVLHRSDILTFTLRLFKEKKILLPNYPDVAEAMQDILNVFVETKQLALREELHYNHKPDKPDDALHAIAWSVGAAYASVSHPILSGASSSADDALAD